MTQGSIRDHLLSYAIPMILGNILQLTYNAVDSIIVGKNLGETALAAVSTVNPIMTIIVLGVSGICIGSSVIMSRFYGAKDMENLKREFSTTLLFGLIASAVVFVVGLLLSDTILKWMRVPEQAIGLSSSYLQIVLVGFIFTFVYNIMSYSMRALGDSRTPVIFLGISSVLNIFLDLLFIRTFRWGVQGAGLATVISQALSCILCFVFIRRNIPQLHFTRQTFGIDRVLLRQTLSNGIVTAVQQSAQPIGKILIQSVINAQGIAAMGAFNAVCRIDDFACIPTQSIGHGITTCVAQNRGAGNRERVGKTFGTGLGIALCYFPIICAATLLFRRPLVSALVPDGSTVMIEMGTAYLSVKAFLFIFPATNNAIQGFFRGMNRMKTTLLFTLVQIGLRTLFVYILVPSMGITGEAWACLAGWLTQALIQYTYYLTMREKILAQVS